MSAPRKESVDGWRQCSKQLTTDCQNVSGWHREDGFDKKNGGSGFHSQCKLCRREQARRYKKRNRPAMTAYLRYWQKLNPERTRELRREHYERNIEKEKAYAREWREANPILRRAYQRMRYVSVKGHRMTDAEWLEVLAAYGDLCLRCGDPDITVDHVIPVSDGGTDTKDNVQPLCLSCNSRKKKQRHDYRPDKGKRWKRGKAKVC